MHRVIIVNAYMGDEFWTPEYTEWFRWAALQILATGYNPISIFHGTDSDPTRAALFLAGQFHSVQWVIPTPNINCKIRDWDKNLADAVSRSEDDVNEYLCPNLPERENASKPYVFDGHTGIIVVPKGMADIYRAKDGGSVTWSTASAHIVRIGDRYEEPIMRTLGTM